LTFGERLQCILDCPECSEPMDIELAIGDLLVSPYPDPRASYETAVAGGGEKRLRFRLPTGGDQEAVAKRSSRTRSCGSRARPPLYWTQP